MRTGASANPAPSGRHVVQCARCGHTCGIEAWRALPREQTLTSADLTRHVSGWPAGATVEVRSCVGCGEPIARKVEAS
jgi:hypothetical protein